MSDVILTISFTYGAVVSILAIIGLLACYGLWRTFRYITLPVQDRLVSKGGKTYNVMFVKKGPFDNIYVLFTHDGSVDLLTEKEFLALNK